MKRLRVTTILLGILVLVFLVPVGLLSAGGVMFILGRRQTGIAAGSGGFSVTLLSVKIELLFVLIIIVLAILVHWIAQRTLRRRNSGLPKP